MLRLPCFHATTIFLAAILLAAPVARSQDLQALTTASREQLDVVKVLLAQQAAWNRGDIEAFAQNYKDAPDTYMVTHQISKGFAGLVEVYRDE